MRLIGVFQVVVGAAIVLTWTVLLATGEVPEIPAGQRSIWFHLVAEGVTALLLVTAGVSLLRAAGPRAIALSAVALGALLYAAMNSPGYYADAGDWAGVAMFALVALATMAAVVSVLRAAARAPEGTTAGPGSGGALIEGRR